MSRWDSDQSGLVIVEGLPDIVFGEDPRVFKVIFNPKKMKNCHNVVMTVVDAEGGQVPIGVDRWGTKMNVTVRPVHETAEGVCTVAITIDDGDLVIGRFWYVR